MNNSLMSFLKQIGRVFQNYILKFLLFLVRMISVQEEYDFLKKKFSSMQELIELKKQKKIIHALKLEILALADDLELKVIDPADEELKVIEAVEKAMKQLKDEYIEVEIDENKSQMSKYSLKSQELTEKLQKLQKLYKEEADVKNSQVEGPPQIFRTSPTESLTSNSPKKSKKHSKSKKNSKEKLSGIKKEKQNKKEWHITLLSV